jgi:hypothetical protein
MSDLVRVSLEDYGFDKAVIDKVETLLTKVDTKLRGHLTQLLVLEPKEVLEPILSRLDEIEAAIKVPSERTSAIIIQEAIANIKE